MVVVNFLSQILHNIGLFSYNFTLISKIWAKSRTFEYVCCMDSQISLAVVKNIHAPLISMVIEFRIQDMILESSSFQLWNFGSLDFGPVPSKWLSFPLPFRKVHTNETIEDNSSQ